MRAILIALLLTFASQAGAVEKDVEYNGAIMMLASYLGFAEYCSAYGINYQRLSNDVIRGFKNNATEQDKRHLTDFERAVIKGNIGYLYSPSAGRYVDIPKEGADPYQTCKMTHQTVLKISKGK